ncbi:MAG: Holliday junction resolvase RuvX [Clostridia bacterium]|nr:Holliday junction resolvase RuvX [Clostridia bacterium]
MRVICLDIGEKRIGVAVTDPLDITAQAVETIWTKGFTKDAERVLALCEQYQTNRVLCGLPLNMDGSEGFQAQRSRAFAQKLSEAGLNIRFQDERLSTKQARGVLLEADVRRGRRKDYIDQLAATYILQGFMDAGGWREDEPTKIELKGVWHMSENMNHELDMEREDIVELVDEDGNAVRFEHLMTLEHEGKPYICLVPVDPMEDVAEDELVILRIDTDENGNDVYATIEDDAELDTVFEKYLEIAEADEDEE